MIRRQTGGSKCESSNGTENRVKGSERLLLPLVGIAGTDLSAAPAPGAGTASLLPSPEGRPLPTLRYVDLKYTLTRRRTCRFHKRRNRVDFVIA